MGQTNKSAKLTLFAQVDQATLDRSVANFRRLEAAEVSMSNAAVKAIQTTRTQLENLVTNMKSESIVSAEAARETEKYAQSIESVGRASKKAVNNLNFYNQAVRDSYRSQNEFLKGAAAVETAQKKLSFYNQAVRDSYSSQNQLLKGRPAAAMPMGGTSGGRASSALSALGSVLPGAGGDIARTAGDLSRLTEQISLLSNASGSAGVGIVGVGGNLTALAALAPLAGIALVALGVAIQGFIKKIQDGKDQLQGAIDSQRLYYEALETGTTESIQSQIDARQNQLNVEKQLLNDLTRAYEQLSDEERLKDYSAGVGSLTDQALKLNEQISQNESSLAKLTLALSSAEVEANDAAAAQQQLAVETEAATKRTEAAAQAQREAVAGAAIDGQLRYFEVVATGTQESIQKALEQARIQQQVAEQQLEFLRAQLAVSSGDESAALSAKIRQLEQTLARSKTEVDAYSRAINSQSVIQRDAAEAAKQASKELATLYDTINERQQSTADAIKQAEFKLAEDRLRLFANYAQRIEDQERQNQRNLAREQRRADFDRLVALKQRELSEFDLLLRGDFAGVARLRREAQAQDEIDRFRGEFEANERLIAQREQDFDNQLDLQRQIAELTKRTHQERLQAQQSDYAFMRAYVQEWFKIKGYMGDVSRLTDAQIVKFYNLIASVAGAPRTTFGAPLGGGSVAPAATPVGRPSIGQSGLGSGFSATGGFTPSGTTVNATFNITGNDTRAIARAVDERLRRVVGG